MLYRIILFYILYMLYRLSIYNRFDIISQRVIWVLKRKIEYDEEDKDDISIYSKEIRESMLDNDELSPMEEAFMSGYEEAV